MPATVITNEPLEAATTADELATLISLRMQAGAIRCWREGDMLKTEWNVFGQNDETAAQR
jgi:hypothetical protein